MCLDDCCKREFHPRKKKSGPYQTTNAYTTPYSCEQVVTLILFIIQLILYCVFVIPPLDDISNAILWVMLGVTFAVLLVIAYDYIYLTVADPVDPLVSGEEISRRFAVEDLTFCVICDRQVQVNSHHCFRCDRCTEDFDHHCKFLNNCIGGQNYEAFFRILCTYSLYNLLIIAQAIWVLVLNLDDRSIALSGNQWGVVTVLVLTGLLELLVGALLGFHCYITLC
jgi:palmitoyltransferase ZDHHC1/11